MPVKIGTGYTAIAAGGSSLALKGNTLYAWGFDGTNMSNYIPVQIGTGYTAIVAGGNHSRALKEAQPGSAKLVKIKKRS